MSQNQLDASLFQLSYDHVAIKKLIVLKTRLGTQKHNGNITQCKQGSKAKPLQHFYLHKHFIEHLTGVPEKTTMEAQPE
jgi:hypothetical protein